MLCVFEVLISFSANVGFVENASSFAGKSDVHEKMMELFGRVNLLGLVLENDNPLALVKGKIDKLFPVSQNQHFFYLRKRQGDQAFQRRNTDSLVKLGN